MNSDSALHRRWWAWLAPVVVLGLVVRVFDLGNIFLWFDETAVFDERIFNGAVGVREFAASVQTGHTIAPGWAVVLWGFAKVFGEVAFVARLPSVLFGTATIVAVFLLVCRIHRGTGTLAGALGAALLVALSITQAEFAQRMYPYASVPVFAAVIVILHSHIAETLDGADVAKGKLTLAVAGYAAACIVGLLFHMSLTLLIFGSVLLLAFHLRRLSAWDDDTRASVVGLAALMVLGVGATWFAGYLHSQSGYRYYLEPYYYTLGLGAVKFLAARTYDLFTYHLDLFYNGALYWPRELNPILLPLVLISFGGWVGSVLGKFGPRAREIAALAAVCAGVTGVLSLFQKYPFGGVRQTLFLSPFVFAFAGIGVAALVPKPVGKALVGVLALAYVALWGANLPRFYEDRVQPYTADELLAVWRDNGQLPIYVDGGARQAIRYTLRDHPEVRLELLSQLPPTPFLILSTHWDIEGSLWYPDLEQQLDEAGYAATLVKEIPPAYPVHPDFRQSLYHPPNGLWIYRVTAREAATEPSADAP